LEGKGAIRVHGGGFGGTVQAYVPTEQFPAFQKEMEAFFGTGSCRILRIRKQGTFIID